MYDISSLSVPSNISDLFTKVTKINTHNTRSSSSGNFFYLGVTITSKLTWETRVLVVSARANKLLGLLRRTCPMLTDVKVWRSLYLALVKSQMSYATEVWSPSHSTLKQKVEKVQRRATRWILQTKQGELS